MCIRDRGCIMPSLVKIGPVVLEKKIFFNFVNVFWLFSNYLPLEKGGALYLNKLESPSPKDALCQVWLKLAQWFWRRRFLNFVNVFHYFVIISPCKRAGLFIWTNWIPFIQRCFVPTLVENGQVVLEKKMKMWKVYDNDDGKRTAHFSLRLRCAKNHVLFKLSGVVFSWGITGGGIRITSPSSVAR